MSTTLKIFLSLTILTLSNGLAQDTQQIQLKPQVARLVVTDLVEGDKAKLEVLLLDEQVTLLKDKIVILDSILGKKENIIINYEEVIGKKDNQLGISAELSNKLETTIKKEKAKSKLYQLGTGGLLLVVLVLSAL
tara:strand:+ start:596 stop:1000 length:405 start_codon:yes stop_codon:yes gene_type:complete